MRNATRVMRLGGVDSGSFERIPGHTMVPGETRDAVGLVMFVRRRGRPKAEKQPDTLRPTDLSVEVWDTGSPTTTLGRETVQSNNSTTD